MPTSALPAYLESVPPEWKPAYSELLNVFRSHLPAGFEETISYGLPSFVVPHSLFPAGYHCKPSEPLPFISIRVGKGGLSVYHMGLYAHKDLMDWFTKAYAEKGNTKLDMGKSCIRFKKPAQIPYGVMGELAGKMTPGEWIDAYQQLLKK